MDISGVAESALSLALENMNIHAPPEPTRRLVVDEFLNRLRGGVDKAVTQRLNPRLKREVGTSMHIIKQEQLSPAEDHKETTWPTRDPYEVMLDCSPALGDDPFLKEFWSVLESPSAVECGRDADPSQWAIDLPRG